MVAIDPAAPRTLLAGTRGGLLFRSTDAAVTWQHMPLPRFPGVTLHAVAIDPVKPSRIWVGLKDPEGANGGLWRSDDAGRTWRPIDELRGRNVLSLVARDAEPHWLAAGTDRGVYAAHSADAAWKLISPAGHPEMNGIVSLEFDRREPDTLFAGTTHLPWKTSDLGQSWNSIHEGMIDDSDVFSILSDRNTPGRMFASACSGIYSSQNGGLNWAKANGIPPDNRRTYIITQDRQYPNLVMAGTTQGLWKSADGGATWKKLHPMPVNWLALDPVDGRVMYLATDGGGILKTMDGGRTFVQRNAGLVSRTVSALAPSAKGLFVSTLYEGEFGGLFLTADRGQSWSLVANQIQLKGENLRRLTISGERLTGTTFSGRIVSRDGGQTWTRLAGGSRRTPATLEPPGTTSARASSKTSAKTALKTGAKTGAKTSSKNAAPTQVAAQVPSPAAQLASDPGERQLPKVEGVVVYDMAVDMRNTRQRLLATSQGLQRSADGGATWKPVRKGLPDGFVRSVVYHPRRSGECYANQYANLYRSRDGGESWELLAPLSSQPLPVVSLVISPWADTTVFALSEDRGVWRRKI